MLTNKLQTTVGAVSLALLAVCWQAPARGHAAVTDCASEPCERATRTERGEGVPASERVRGLGTKSPDQATDLNQFMKAVLEKRDDNWKKLQQYILEEREKVEVRGPAGLPLWGQKREYQWFIREGYFIRSPLTADGVTVPDADRRKYEDSYLKRIKTRDQKAKEAKPGDSTGGNAIVIGDAGVEVFLQQSHDPQFVDSAYFMRFKFDNGRYALVGKEKIAGTDVLRIEYYPTKLFNDDPDPNRKPPEGAKTEVKPVKDPEKAQREAKREKELDQAVDKLMNKNSKVTIWVEPKAHQIVRYVFDNVKMDFLPAGWLLRMDELKASMTMSQPFKDVWLPQNVEMYFSAMFAIGTVDVRFNLDYYDYREASTAAKIKGRGGF